MRGTNSRRSLLSLAFCLSFSLPLVAANAEIVSSMRNVNAVAEAHGFRLNPAYDSAQPAGAEDLAPPQAFEVVRPDGGKPVTIGRLYTSCSCIQLESPKRTFGSGERAILQLRNLKPTPTNGQVYSLYVQITSPIRTTLRFDTFVQSQTPLVAAATPAPSSSSSTTPPYPSAFAGGVELVELAKPATDLTAIAAEANAPETAEKTAEKAAEKKDDGAAEAAPEKKDETAAAAPASDSAAQSATSATAEAAPAKEEEREAIPSLETAKAEMDALFAKKADETRMVAGLQEGADAIGDFAEKTLEAVAAVSESSAAPASPEAAAVPSPLPPPAEEAKATAAAAPAPVASAAPAVALEAPAADRPAKPFQTITLITIGVKDMARAINFYEELGWRRTSRNKYDQTAFFQLNGQVLALYPLPDLLKEQNMEDAKQPVPGGITLALHVPGKAEVVELYRRFIAAGGRSLREPTEMPSGAVTSYVADPDGNPWEISWVPQFRVDAEGGLWLP